MTPRARAFFESLNGTSQVHSLVEHVVAESSINSGEPPRSLHFVVLPTSTQLEKFQSEIQMISDSGFEVRALLSFDQLPSLKLSSQSSILHQRAITVSKLQERLKAPEIGPPLMVLSTWDALSFRIPPPDTLESRSLLIEPERALPLREDLHWRFFQLGYQRTPEVKDPGTYSLRGDILDIFCPDQELPIRIDLFDDMIERVRRFDPWTQLSQAKDSGKSKFKVYPIREWIHDQSAIEGLKTNLRKYCEEQSIQRRIRDPFLESLEVGIYPSGCEYFFPWWNSSPLPLYQYFLNHASWWWIQPETCKQEWEAYKLQLEQALQREPLLPHLNLLWDTTDPLDVFRPQNFRDLDLEHQWKDIPRPASWNPWIEERLHQHFEVTLYYQDQDWQDRLKGVLSQEVLPWVKWKQGLLSNSLIQTVRKKILLADFEVLGVPKKLKRTLDFSSIQKWRSIQNTNELLEEDLVIHRIHGLGRYRGLKRIHTQGAGEMDVLELEFADGDRLYLPVYRMDVIQKYGTIENQEIKLDKLGGQGFQLRTQKVREAVKLLAVDLLKIHATRKMTNIQPFTSHPEEMERFTDLFPFTETPDQLKALKEIDEDLESGKLMDRLLCGDVGFGKTEVALRAAYRAILEGYQVALLCPTTLLTLQHENTCIHRFEPFAIRVKSLSRFKSTREQKEVLKSLEDGSLDLVIGTHRLLSRDVRFKKLGLLIVDEEQKLGVEHKEKIKELAQNCHVLTLTATPIPRTLHLALSGLRDLTILQTPPMRKSSIRTEVHREDWDLIIDAVRFELARDGQVFIVYPHIQELRKIQDKLKEPFPSVPTAMAHGQMGELELEQIILDFYQGKLKVLISTSIIESGLDIPAANTIIVLRSELFGLSQLYQIRGRVGRGERRGYAYLFTGSDGILTTEAQQRLDTLKRYTELGSGFQIASQDLDIRGAGDLLGTKQSGHIHAVGIDLYLELLEEAIRDLKRQTPKDTVTSRTRSPEIQLDLPCYLEDTYIPDLPQRLSIYRRISSLRDREMLHHLKHELLERFGPLPVEGENLFRLVEVKILLMEKGVEKLTVGSERISLHFGPNSPIDLPKAFALVASQPESFRLTPDGKFTLPYHGRTFPELEIALKKVWERILGA